MAELMDQITSNIADLESSFGSLATTIGSLAVEYTVSVIGAIVLLIVGFMVAGQVRRLVYKAIKKTKHFSFPSGMLKIPRMVKLLKEGQDDLCRYVLPEFCSQWHRFECPRLAFTELCICPLTC